MQLENLAQRVLELLDSGESWCKKAFARDFTGKSLPPTEHGAVRWCISGAIGYVLESSEEVTLNGYSIGAGLHGRIETLTGLKTAVFNDEASWEDVALVLKQIANGE